uniref:TetR family transcriptional regulator n=5 Tax=Nocardia seriolae TaxID=37332 RepID=UPI0035C6F61D
MAVTDARERIILAAEQLIAERGPAVPLRDIAAAAGQRNNSAIQYHFGSRDGLVRQRHLCESVLVDLLCGVGSCCGRVGFVDESDRGSVRAVGAARA